MNHLPPKLQKYLVQISDEQLAKARATRPDAMVWLLATSGVLKNWVADWLSDQSVQWEERRVKVDGLVLTGTNAEWNKIVIDQAQRDPKKLRELLNDPKIRSIFDSAKFRPDPILIRSEMRDGKEKFMLLDGMNRTIAAIRDGILEMDAWIGRRHGKCKSQVEVHVVYDLLKAHQQGRGSREDLIAALRFLRDSFGNVDEILQTEFGDDWFASDYMKGIVKEVLK